MSTEKVCSEVGWRKQFLKKLSVVSDLTCYPRQPYLFVGAFKSPGEAQIAEITEMEKDAEETVEALSEVPACEMRQRFDTRISGSGTCGIVLARLLSSHGLP